MRISLRNEDWHFVKQRIGILDKKKRKKNFNCPRIPPPMIKCQSIEEKGGGGGGGG